MRFGLPTKVEISCFSPGQEEPDWLHTGIAVDISLGGICIDMGPSFESPEGKSLKGKSVQLRLDLLNDLADLNITGKIVWHRRQPTEKGMATYTGIRFDTLNKEDREMLFEYCSGSVGEQNLLWSLWDTMIRSGA